MALQLPPAPLRRCASSADLRPPSPLQTRPMSPRITSLSSPPSATGTTTTITALSPSRAPKRHENTTSPSRLGTAPALGRSPASSPRLPRAAPLQNTEEVVSFRLAQGLRPALAPPSTPALATPRTPPYVRRRQRSGLLQAGANVDRAGDVACEFELEPERERDPPRPRLRRTSSLGDLEHAVVQWAEVSGPAYATGGGGHWRLANDLPAPEAELDDDLPLPPRTGFAAGRRQHVAAYLRRQHEALGGRWLASGRPTSGRPTSGRPTSGRPGTAAAAAEMARRPQTVAHNLSSSPPTFYATTRPATTASASTSAELWLGPVGAAPGSPSPPQRTPHPPGTASPAGLRSPNVSRRGNRRRAATDAPAVHQPGDLEGVLTATQQPTPGPPPPKPREILVREDPNTTMFNGVRSPPGVWRPATAATAHTASSPSPPATALPGGRLPPLVRTTPESAGGLDDPGVDHAVEQLVASRAGSAVGRRRAQAPAADPQPPTQGHLVPPGRLAGPVQHSTGALPAGMRRTLLAGGAPEEHMSREEVLARLAAHMSRGGIVTPGVAPAAYRGLDQADDDEAEGGEGEDAERYGNVDPAYMHMSRMLTRHARNINNNGDDDDELLAGASTATLTGLALEDTMETGSTWAAQPMALASQPRPCDNCIPVRVGGGFLFVGFGDDHSRCLKCGRHLDTNLNDAHEKERLVASMEAMAPAQDDESDAEHASSPVVEAVKRSARFRKPAAPKEAVPPPVKLKTQKASSNADTAPAPATTTDNDNSNDAQASPPPPLPPPAVADEATTAEAASPRSEEKMVIGKNAIAEDPYANLSLEEALALSKKMEDEGAATLGPKLRWKEDTYKGVNPLAATREYSEPGSPPTANPGGIGGHRPATEATTTAATPRHGGDGDALPGGDASDGTPTSASRGAAAPMTPGASPPLLDERLRNTSHSSTGPLVRETAGALSPSVATDEEPQPPKASPPGSQGAPLRKGAAADGGPAAAPQAAASNGSPTVQKKKRKALPTHQPTSEGVDANVRGGGGDPARGQTYTKLGLLSDEESSEDEKEERAPAKAPKRKPKLLPMPMPAATTDPFADPRWQSKEERPHLDLLKELIDDDGSDAGLPLSDTISYLSKFCLLDAQKLSRYRRIFLESDRDQDNHLNMRELCQGLRSVTEDQITKREMDFVIRVLELADDTGLAKDRLKSRVTFRVFAVVAALSERVSGLDGDVKGLINSLNAKGLEARLKLAKHLFYVNDTSQQGSIELDQVEVELHAGNLSDEHRDDIMNTLHKEGMMSLTFLDYLAYIPLFLDIHDTIVDNPLDDSKRR